ncbi:MAG: hypothetical protein OXH00_10565 [Candidatus Poribacteria bacterium]|nr:hypothetical protein [Candidatus Poribacteria bacterium]
MVLRSHKIALRAIDKHHAWFAQQGSFIADRDVNAAINLRTFAIGWWRG